MSDTDAAALGGTPAKPAGVLSRMVTTQGMDLSKVAMNDLLVEVLNRLERNEFAMGDSRLVALGDAVADRLALRLDIHDNRFSAKRFLDIFTALHHQLTEPKPTIEGKTFLDLGCGSVHPLGISLLMCMLGAARAIGVDLDPVQDRGRAVRGLVRLVDLLLQNPIRIVGDYPITREQIEHNLRRAGIDVEVLRRGDPAGIGKNMQLLHDSAHRLPLPDESVDVIVSNSFLEHVADLDAVFTEIARVTAKGGFGVHIIDGVDHRSYRIPQLHELAFLREPGRGWFDVCNRLRPLEYPAVFERHGFQVQQIRPHTYVKLSAEDLAAFAAPWSTMPLEVLEMTRATVVVRKI